MSTPPSNAWAFDGIQDLQDAPPLKSVRKALLKILEHEPFLVGHSVHYDRDAIGISYNSLKIRDTAHQPLFKKVCSASFKPFASEPASSVCQLYSLGSSFPIAGVGEQSASQVSYGKVSWLRNPERGPVPLRLDRRSCISPAVSFPVLAGAHSTVRSLSELRGRERGLAGQYPISQAI